MRSVPLCVFCLGRVRRLACLRGGQPGPVPSVPGFGSCAPLRAGLCVWGGPASGGAGGRGGGGGGGGCVPPPMGAWPGGPEGRGVALPRSVPLPSLGGDQSGCHRRRSVHGGRGLHTAPVRVRVWTPGVDRGLPLCAGVGPPACRGPCGSRRVAAWGRLAYWRSGVPVPGAAALFGGGASSGFRGGRVSASPWTASSIPRAGWGGSGGERGGGRALVPRHPPPVPLPTPSAAAGRWPVAPGPGHPSWPAAWRCASLPAVCSVGAVWQPRAQRAGCRPPVGQFGGGRGGRSVRRPSSGARPGGPGGRGAGGALPRSVPLPPSGGHQSGPLRHCPVSHLFPCSRPRAAARMRPAGCLCVPA